MVFFDGTCGKKMFFPERKIKNCFPKVFFSFFTFYEKNIIKFEPFFLVDLNGIQTRPFPLALNGKLIFFHDRPNCAAKCEISRAMYKWDALLREGSYLIP